jgi:hypothetical protein
MHAACDVNLIIYLIIQVTFGEEHKLCIILQPVGTSSLQDTQIVLST